MDQHQDDGRDRHHHLPQDWEGGSSSMQWEPHNRPAHGSSNPRQCSAHNGSGAKNVSADEDNEREVAGDESDALFSDSSDEEEEDRGKGPKVPPSFAVGAVGGVEEGQAQGRYHPNDPRSRMAASSVTTAPVRKPTDPRLTPTAVDMNDIPRDAEVIELDTKDVPDDGTKADDTAHRGPSASADGEGSEPLSSPPDGLDAPTLPSPPSHPPTASECQPASLPSDVVHIQEVEWAEPPSDSPSHSSPSPTPVSGITATGVYDYEKAPRPRVRRIDDPCGCVPVDATTPCCTDMSCVLFACQEECRSDCYAGELCGNKRITKRQWKNLQVFDAGLKGRGLRTLEKLKKDDFITEYVGVAVRKKHLDDLFRRYRKERMLYIMALDNDVYIDARKRGGIARYINHGCEPNCAVHRWKVRGVSRAGIFALRDIEEGEELSFDYQWDRKRGRSPTTCHCKAPSCRGTLELAKVSTVEEEELENKLKGHWKVPDSKVAGREIINRSIKIYYDGNHEYFAADVCKFDPDTGKHLVIYQGDQPEESWEDLSKEQWLILDEEAERFVIRKKADRRRNSLPPSPLLPVDGAAPSVSKKVRNYIIVPTAIKEYFVSRHLIRRCQGHYRVQISSLLCANPFSDDEESITEESCALKNAKDGNFWKLTITGLNPGGAKEFLEKNVDPARKALEREAEAKAAEVAAAKELAAAKKAAAASGVGIATMASVVSAAAKAEAMPQQPKLRPGTEVQEFVVPRSAVEAIRRRLNHIRAQINCRGINVTFCHSDSKSKKFAKLILEGQLRYDIKRATKVLWDELLSICRREKVAVTSHGGMFQDLGIFGGELTTEQFELLYCGGEDGDGKCQGMAPPSLSQDCHVDLSGSVFFTSFEDAQRCTIWVQSSDDMGRIDSELRVVNQSTPNAPRKVFFGCEPKRVQHILGLLQNRFAELKRGVRYLHLGVNRVYLRALVQSRELQGGRRTDDFFEYVRKTTGATVSADSLTTNHLRIDGGQEVGGGLVPPPPKSVEVDGTNDAAKQRIAFAEELINLQIELFRDHFISRQRWGFGRDWTLLMDADASSAASTTPEPFSCTAASAASAAGCVMPQWSGGSATAWGTAGKATFEPRSVANSCIEMADIAAHLKLPESAAAHAAIILYRFLNRSYKSSGSPATAQLKLREISVACVFLANKAQKVMKWKRLESVLSVAYFTFYGSDSFNESSEEAAMWEKRVLCAEHEILTVLDYDVFWPGTDWIVTAASDGGGIGEPLAQNAMELTLSGPVLAAGPTLWLKYGPEYAFAAIAGFLSIGLERLFPALSLNALKVSHAAELIAESIRLNHSYGKKSGSSCRLGGGGSRNHELFRNKAMLNTLPHIQNFCWQWMRNSPSPRSTEPAGLAKTFQIVGRRDRQLRAIRNVDCKLVFERILPHVDRISTESKCQIFFKEGLRDGQEDVVLEGGWRALAIAEHLLESAVASAPSPVRESQPMVDISSDADSAQKSSTLEVVTVIGNGHVGETSSVDNTVASTETPTMVSPVSVCAASSSSTTGATMTTMSSMGQQKLPTPVDIEEEKDRSVKMQAKLKPGVLRMGDLCTWDGWEGTSSSHKGRGRQKVGDKFALAAKCPESALREAGLRWWLPPSYGPSLTGWLCDIFLVRKSCGADDAAHLDALARVTQALIGESSVEIRHADKFRLLSSLSSSLPTEEEREDEGASGSDRTVSLSIQRWPSEKVEARERVKKTGFNMDIGFSAAALQEMQLLNQLHCLIPTPQGHPNFLLPIAVVLPSFSSVDNTDTTLTRTDPTLKSSFDSTDVHSDDVFSLFRTSEENERVAKLEQKKKANATGPHLMFQPTPFVLQRVLTKSKRRGEPNGMTDAALVTPSLVASWFHDLLSATAHCHANHTVMRNINPDQILIDHSGVIKLSGLSLASVLKLEDRGRFLDPLKSARGRREVGRSKEDDEILSNPYSAPELLLGSTRYTKETDIWSMGCLMTHLLLGKPLFAGRGRVSKFQAIFKIVGSPSSSIYPDGERFPFYEQPRKSYKKGIQKALRFMWKSSVNIEEYAGFMSLLDQMLDLDPQKRVTAADALGHECMKDYMEQFTTESFRKSFVKDWMHLKSKILADEESDKPSKGDDTERKRLREKKRKAMLMEAASNGVDDEEEDDLYNLDDLLGMADSKNGKR